MRPRLDATNLTVHDLADQPPTRYILLIENLLGGKGAVGVDQVYQQSDGVMVGERYVPGSQTLTRVAMWPRHLQWIIVQTGVMERISTQDYYRKVAEDKKAVEALEDELLPEEAAKARQAQGDLGRMVMMLPGGQEEKPVVAPISTPQAVGQYL